METAGPVFERILLKLSGEALMGDMDYGIDPGYIRRLATEVKAVSDAGVEVAMVIGLTAFQCRMPWKIKVRTAELCLHSKSTLSAKITFVAELYAIWKRGASYCSRLEQVIRFLPLILLRVYARWKSALTS